MNPLIQEYLLNEMTKVEYEIDDEIKAIRTKSALVFRLERLQALLVKKELLTQIWRDLRTLGAFRY